MYWKKWIYIHPVKKHSLFLHVCFLYKRYECCLARSAWAAGFADYFSATAHRLRWAHPSECLLANAWLFPVLMNRAGCHNKLLSSRTDFERKKANSNNVNVSWAFQLMISGDQYHSFKWPCITPAIILSTFMSTWHFPRNFSTGKEATV